VRKGIGLAYSVGPIRDCSEPPVRLLQRLRNHLHVRHGRHEVGVAAPSRHDVYVQVPRNSGSSGLTQIHPDVVSLWTKRLIKPILAAADHVGQFVTLCFGEVRVPFDLAVWSDEKMPVVVGKQVHQHEDALSSPNNEMRLVIIRGGADPLKEPGELALRTMITHESRHVL